SSKLAWIRFSLMTWMSPQLRASNEGLLRPRVARAQGTRQAITIPAGGIFQHPASVVSRKYVHKDGAPSRGSSPRCGPHKGPGSLVIGPHEVLDLGDQLLHAVERPSANGLLRDVAEPEFDLIEPGCIGRGVMHMIPRA